MSASVPTSALARLAPAESYEVEEVEGPRFSPTHRPLPMPLAIRGRTQ